MSEIPTLTELSESLDVHASSTAELLALVVVWSPDRAQVGEVFLLDGDGPLVVGRAPPGPSDAGRVIGPIRQLPGRNAKGRPVVDPRLSRHQLRLERTSDPEELRVENVGRCPMRIDGDAVEGGILRCGHTVSLRGSLVLLLTRRPELLPALVSFPRSGAPPFGEPDEHGIVGESPAAWTLRERAAFAARRQGHVLISGSSGTGKELAARTIHGLSDRRRRPLVSRNAATIPQGLVDAELFGNIKDYPNPGMPERAGLVGQADRTTLFLDEIGEIPEEVQAHLLRVLDDGEYHRLGQASPQRSDLRMIAATNRSPTQLKHDLLARFPIRLTVPDLDARREDVPLLAAHLLRVASRSDPDLGPRFFAEGHPRLSLRLVDRLVRHPYTHHVRELHALLWQAIAESPGDVIELGPGLTRTLDGAEAEVHRGAVAPAVGSTRPATLTPDALRAALERNDGILERTWRDLGLKNRFQLMRLLKKHGLTSR